MFRSDYKAASQVDKLFRFPNVQVMSKTVMSSPGSKLNADAKAAIITPRLSRAQRTRELTRAKLLEAANRVMAEKGVDATTIADITEAADVSTGSFYNHFQSKLEIAEQIFLRHASSFAKVNVAVFDRETDPAQSIAYIHKIFLTRAVQDPLWGWFVVHATTDLPQVSNVFAKTAAEHVRAGQSAGRFDIADVDVAVRIILVALIAGMRDLLEGEKPAKWTEHIIQSLLQMLGLTAKEAKALSQKPLPDYVGRLVEESIGM